MATEYDCKFAMKRWPRSVTLPPVGSVGSWALLRLLPEATKLVVKSFRMSLPTRAGCPISRVLCEKWGL